jgi:glutamine synthetase
MVGASATLSNPNTVLNTIVAKLFTELADKIETRSENMPLESYVDGLIKELYKTHKRVIFSGNNYSQEWEKEAKRRGLSNIDNCVDAYGVLLNKENVKLFESMRVYTETELKIRRDIYIENYAHTVSTEALTMLAMSSTEILPKVIKYQGDLAAAVVNLRLVDPDFAVVTKEELKILSEIAAEIKNKTDALKATHAACVKLSDNTKKAIVLRDRVIPAMDELRAAVDRAESVMPKTEWAFPTYSDILFYNE